MAYFSHGDVKQKLMLLYFLNEIGFALPRGRLYTIFAEQGWMEYFDFQSNLTQLEEDAHVAAVPCAFGQGYCVTPHGQDALALFKNELPHSIKEKLSQYAGLNKTALKSDTQFSATQSPMPDGGALVILRLMDNNAQILTISLQTPGAAFAQRAAANWPKEAGGIYREILNRLLPDNE
ncbi:MAG: DUF4364 family protein [Clostridiales bacterium]|jgi:hypothetical protein|nr:DUF4364 family protein [Clostridiales bacterium]